MNGQERIDRMYAFICVDEDGSEGIPAFLNDEGMFLPMVGADMKRIDSLRPIAEEMTRKLNKPISLCVFSNRREVEVIYPAEQGKPS